MKYIPTEPFMVVIFEILNEKVVRKGIENQILNCVGRKKGSRFDPKPYLNLNIAQYCLPVILFCILLFNSNPSFTQFVVFSRKFINFLKRYIIFWFFLLG